MQPDPEPRKTVFFHVLKTGGTTFSHILRDLYPGSFEVIQDPRLDLVQAALSRSECIEFHTRALGDQLINMHSGLSNGNRFDLLHGHNVFTMLRDPVDQVLSLYGHVMRHAALVEPLLESSGQRFPRSLEEFTDEPRHFNSQTAFLADRNQLLQLADTEDLAKASRLLTDLDIHVGLTEHFSDSVHILEQVTGRQIPGRKILNRNRHPIAPGATPVSEALRQRIRERSALDMALFEFGRKRFLADRAIYGAAPVYEYAEEQATPAPQPAQTPSPGLWARLKAKLAARTT